MKRMRTVPWLEVFWRIARGVVVHCLILTSHFGNFVIWQHLKNRYFVSNRQDILNKKLQTLDLHKKKIQDYEQRVHNLEKKLFKN